MNNQQIASEVKGLYMSEVIKMLHSFTPPIPLKYDAVRMYSLDRLAPEPLIEGGKGKGNKTVYPVETPAEIAASYRMIKKYPGYKNEISGARKIALHIESSNFNAYSDLRSDEELCLMLRGDEFKALLAGQWLREKLNNIGKVENLQKTSFQIKLKHEESTELINLNEKDFLSVQDKRRLLVRVYPVLAMISTWGQSNPMFPVLFNPQ
ncbi:MAG: hypothetical protein JXB48_24740 [Candidatus Latescibacteria bacterium]|nr:hypothetical protein [Candidatus Latescibacterota bacterium]